MKQTITLRQVEQRLNQLGFIVGLHRLKQQCQWRRIPIDIQYTGHQCKTYTIFTQDAMRLMQIYIDDNEGNGL